MICFLIVTILFVSRYKPDCSLEELTSVNTIQADRIQNCKDLN